MTRIKDLMEEYISEKKKIKFFDANCWLGAPISESLIKIPETVDELLDVMDYYGIERSVVCSSLALNYNVVYGNASVLGHGSRRGTSEKQLKEINKNDRLYAGAILLPEHTNEFGNISNYISFLIKNKVVLVKLFPKIHNFVLSKYCIGSLLKVLEERKIPVSIWHTQTTWDEIDKLCKDYSDLPVIIEGVGRKLFYDNRIFYPLLKKHKNLFIETHNITNYLGLDDIVKQFRAEKLLFGTFIPENDPEASLMQIAYGDFSYEEKQMIAGNNLLSLISNIEK